MRDQLGSTRIPSRPTGREGNGEKRERSELTRQLGLLLSDLVGVVSSLRSLNLESLDLSGELENFVLK